MLLYAYIGSSFFTVSSYPKSSLKREYSRREEIPPPRSRAVTDYGSRVVQERRPSFRDDYSSRAPGYSDVPRGSSRTSARRAYVDDGYGQRFERPPPPPPSYREGRARDYDSISGSKRSYSSMVSFSVRCFSLITLSNMYDSISANSNIGNCRMMSLHVMLTLVFANQGHAWTMSMEVVLLSTGMLMVTDLDDLI